MLQFASGIRFRMDIADFLQLQAALQTDGVIQPAPDEENIVGLRKLGCEPLQALLVVQHMFDLFRYAFQRGNQLLLAFRCNGSAHAAQQDRQNVHRNQLAAVRLRGCYGDFRSRIGIHQMIRIARDGGAHHVYNTQRGNAHALRHAQRRQRIRRFAGLRNHNQQSVL